MSQQKYWEQEYREPKFLSLSQEPQHEVLRFLEWLQREADYDPHGRVVLDLGCGNGRNLNYLVGQYGCSGFGYDVSETAIEQARAGVQPEWLVQYEVRSIGEPWPLLANSIDIALDITSSPSLYAGERATYFEELARVLKPSGYALVRLLLLDGDRNAKNMLQKFPGPEGQTYIHPDTFIIEHVITEKQAHDWYGRDFEILALRKHTGYQRWGNQSYKRRYISLYLKKKV